jgi:SAM-dependent methyltransferase
MSSRFPDHFSHVAARYAGFRPRYPAALFDHLATLVPRDAVVWDCACGSGQATADLARRFARVVATDASPEQIAAAAALPNVEFRVALAEASGLADGEAALVTVAQALHWFDLPRFYAEVRRVVRPGGAIAAWCYGVHEIEGQAVDALVQDFYAGTLGPYWPPSRRLVETGYRTLPFPFEESAAPAFRMEARWTLEQLLGYLGTWSATSRYVEARGEDPLGPLAANLARVWGAGERRVEWPLSLRIGLVGHAGR